MKRKVILTQKYQEEVIRQLQETFQLIIVEGSGKSLLQIVKENPDTEALIPFLSDPMDKKIMDLLPQLKIIANYAVGYNNIDVAHAVSRGIRVTNTPDILTHATADLTMTLILAVCRRIVEGDNYVRQGQFTGWGANLMLGKELYGSTIGIIGLGRIGTAVALRAQSFGMKVAYYSRTRKPQMEKEHGFQYMTFRDLVAAADVISPHIPAGEGTHHLFNKEIFDRMKPDAVFVNVARGNIMDEKVLAEKLTKNELFGAGLDVYEYEPKITEELRTLKNVVLAPHIGSATYTARLGMAQKTIDNINRFFAGQTPQDLVPECNTL